MSASLPPGGHRSAERVIARATEHGWDTFPTYSEEHGSLAVRFWRDDEVRGYALWTGKGFGWARLQNGQKLSYNDVLTYLADPSVIDVEDDDE
jgi:hypothetical protein